MTVDPIADMLTQIRNALLLKKESIELPDSKLKREISRILKDNGYIADYNEVSQDKFKKIKVSLRYQAGKSVIQGLKRVSRPGRRVYFKKDEIPRVMGGLGVAIVSTSQGVLTGHQARRQGLGGEVLCYVW